LAFLFACSFSASKSEWSFWWCFGLFSPSLMVDITNFGLEWLDNVFFFAGLPTGLLVGLAFFLGLFLVHEGDNETDLDLERLDTDEDRDLLAVTGLPPGEADRCGVGLKLFDILANNGGITMEFI
jgi:hypothetical protein